MTLHLCGSLSGKAAVLQGCGLKLLHIRPCLYQVFLAPFLLSFPGLGTLVIPLLQMKITRQVSDSQGCP